MALIPSESYSFPDEFVRTISHARKSLRQPSPPVPEPEPIQEEVRPAEEIEAPLIEKIEMPLADRMEAHGIPLPLMAEPEPEPEAKLATEAINEAPETKPEKTFIPSLVPATLKRKIRWNARAAQMQSIPPTSGEILNQPVNEERPELNFAPPVPVKAKPDVRPKISFPPPIAFESEPPAPPAAEPLSPDPLPPESRTVEAPSADLIQTLLARALFASSEPMQAAAPVAAEPLPVTREFRPPTNGHFAVVPQKPHNAPAPRQLPEQRPVPERKRSNPKLRRFLISESIAVGVLIPLAILGLLRVFQNPILIAVIDVITIAAAFAATLMPILFFAVAPSLPRSDE